MKTSLKSKSFQNFNIDGKHFSLPPYGDPRDTTEISDEYADDQVIRYLVNIGSIEIVGQDVAEQKHEEVVAEQKAVEEAKPEVKVVSANENKENDVRLIKCAATKANGDPCNANVQVPYLEYDETVPYFCGRHKKEVAEDYERVDGKWVKLVKPEIDG